MNRRQFIQTSASAVATTSLVLSACKAKSSRSAKTAADIEPDGEMTYRINPNTGDKVSLLGFGMMRLPVVDGGSARENPDSPIDQEAVNELVDYAMAHGVNLYDTSPAYCQGQSEQALGKALSRYPRNKYFISTKLSNFSPDTWSREESQAIFENSLRQLQTDYVDYLLMHGVGMSAPDHSGMEAFYARYIDNGMLDWLVQQKQNGRIRNLGFSYHGDYEVFSMLLKWHDEGKYHWDFVLIELNYLDWNYAKETNTRNTDASLLYAELERRGIPVFVMEPLLGGRLAKQPNSIVQMLKQQDPEATVASWAFRYAGTPKDILCVLSGMTYLEHLQDNVCTYSPLRPINAEEDALLMRVAAELNALKAIPCTGCDYCMPCPYGLNIPAIFAHYNNMLTEGLPQSDGSKWDSEYRRARRKYLISYDRAIPSERQADHCIHCRRCLSHCPQRIPIPREMSRINRLVQQLRENS